MYKVTILFVSLATALLTTPPPENAALKLPRYQMECIEETRVDSDVIVKIKRKSWSIPRNQLPLVKDWTHCVLMKTGVMTREGVYKVDVALSRVPLPDRGLVEEQIDSCLSQKPIPAWEIAFKFVKCFQKRNQEFGTVVSAF